MLNFLWIHQFHQEDTPAMNVASMSFLATRNELPLPGCWLAGKSKISQLLTFTLLSWGNSSNWERKYPAEATWWSGNFCVRPLDAPAEHHNLSALSRYYRLRKGKALKFSENSRDVCRSASWSPFLGWTEQRKETKPSFSPLAGTIICPKDLAHTHKHLRGSQVEHGGNWGT